MISSLERLLNAQESLVLVGETYVALHAGRREKSDGGPGAQTAAGLGAPSGRSRRAGRHFTVLPRLGRWADAIL